MRERIRVLIGACLIVIGLIAVWPIIQRHQSPKENTSPPTEQPGASRLVVDTLSPTTFNERLKTTFPNIYLTLISIIEGVAVYTLSVNTYDYVMTFNKYPHLLGYFPYWLQYVPFSLTSFGLIVMVAFEYMWLVALFRWSPRLLDVTIPLGIGFFEILPMYYLTNPFGYCVSVALFCFSGAFAYWYSWRYFPLVDITEDYKKDAHNILERSYRTAIGFSIGSGGAFSTLSVFISQNIFSINNNSYLQEVMVWGPAIILEAIILVWSDQFLKVLAHAFNLPENKVPAKRWFPWLKGHR